jgi:hypothetical protein
MKMSEKKAGIYLAVIKLNGKSNAYPRTSHESSEVM